MTHDVVNVLECGADPNGARESTQAFRDALARSTRVLVPFGVYMLSGMVQGEPEEPVVDTEARSAPVAEAAGEADE